MSEVNVETRTATFNGYIAEMIRLQAEKGMSPEAYVLSFFEMRCNAPEAGRGQSLENPRNASFCRRGALHLQ